MRNSASGPNWIGIWTLVRRWLIRYLRNLPEVAGRAVGMGLLFLLVFSVALPEDVAFQPGVTALQFLAPGLIAWAMFSDAFDNVAFPLLFDRMEGMIQDVLMAPLSPAERLAGYLLPGLFGGLLTGLFLGLVFSFIIDLPLAKPFLILPFALLGCLLFSLIGLLCGLWAIKWDHFAMVENFLVLPLGLLSGSFFTLASLPEAGRTAILANPVFHIIDGLRSGFTGTAESGFAVGLLLPVLVVVLLFWLSQRLFRRGYRIRQ